MEMRHVKSTVFGLASTVVLAAVAATGVPFLDMPPGRAVVCPEGLLASAVRAAGVSEANGAFTVAFRFKAARYMKREGPWEGLVFANGNGWNNGFRATMTPEVNNSPDGFRMSLRVVKAQGGAASVPVNGVLGADRWYCLAFVMGGGELKSYVNGALSAKRRIEGGFKRPSCGVSVGPAGFGVGYYPFEARDFIVWDRALGDDEVLALVTGGEVSAKGVAAFLQSLDEASFADMRTLAWNTAKRLTEVGERNSAAELYALLAKRPPANPTVDGGNEIAAQLANELGGIEIRPAVKWPEIVSFRGYAAFEDRVFHPDVATATFVAPYGDDSTGDGSEDRPFGSVGRALDAVRGRSEKTILLKGGRYVLERGIKIGAADSGSERSPLVVAAAPGETPVLDGGRDVDGFAPCGLGEVLVADLRGRGFAGMERPLCWGYAMSGKGERHILDLYEDDKPGNLARHPNSGFFAAKWADGTNLTFRIDLPDIADWAKEPELMALSYMRWLWGDETTALTINVADGTMQLDTNLVKRVKVGHPVKLLNSLKAIDEPGEWFLDHADQKLYFWPRRKGARVTLSQLAEPIVGMEGAKHVEIRGLVLQNGRADGIRVEKCAHVRIVKNMVRNLGSGMAVRGEDIVIFGNRMRSFSYGGICVHGGDRKTLKPSGIRILDNNISDIERKVRTYCPCVHAEGVGIEIAFNHFHDCPSSAIRLEGNDMLVNSNLVENCVLESDDQGAIDIYANPTYAGIEIIGNIWRNIGRGGPFAPCGQAAVRFDDVISGVKVRLNRFYNCGWAHFGAVQINGGRLNVVDNNLFVDCRLDCSINIRHPAWWRKTMTTGSCGLKIAAMNLIEPPWRERYPYMACLLEWPCMNFVSRNMYVNTPRTCRPAGENGNVTLPVEPLAVPVGYDALPSSAEPSPAKKHIGERPLVPMEFFSSRVCSYELAGPAPMNSVYRASP